MIYFYAEYQNKELKTAWHCYSSPARQLKSLANKGLLDYCDSWLGKSLSFKTIKETDKTGFVQIYNTHCGVLCKEQVYYVIKEEF